MHVGTYVRMYIFILCVYVNTRVCVCMFVCIFVRTCAYVLYIHICEGTEIVSKEFLLSSEGSINHHIQQTTKISNKVKTRLYETNCVEFLKHLLRTDHILDDLFALHQKTSLTVHVCLYMYCVCDYLSKKITKYQVQIN